MSDLGQNDILAYFISTKNGYAVVSFIGGFTKDSDEVIERCQNELMAADGIKYVAFNFRDINRFDRPAIPAFIRLQAMVRDRNCELRLASVRPDIKEILTAAGAIRLDEAKNNLPEALQSFSKKYL